MHSLFYNQWIVLVPAFLILSLSCLFYRLHRQRSAGSARDISALKRSQQEMSDLYLSTIQSLAMAIDAKDPYAHAHIVSVQRLAVAIAGKMGLQGPEMAALETGALLHDIGKLGVPEYILLKMDRLTPEEFITVQKHSETGAMILEPIRFPWPVVEIVRHHHERYNGSGYPDGLRGEAIPIGARILGVADVYDALSSSRPYRSAWSPQEAAAYIHKGAGCEFDPAVVAAFLEVARERSLTGDPDQPAAFRSGVAASAPGGQAKGDMQKAVDSIARAHQEIHAIQDIARSASASLHLDEVLSLLTHKARGMMDASACAILLPDAKKTRLEVRSAAGINEALLAGASCDMGKGVTGQVASALKPYLGRYEEGDLALAGSSEGWKPFRYALIVPLMAEDRLIGTLHVYHEAENAFSPDDLRVLGSVSRQAGRAVDNALLFEQTRESALTDPLTGLHNHRGLLLFLEQELDRARRRRHDLSILSLDLDNFKPINDTFGHMEGDRVLADLGRLFKSQARAYDMVCRYAGDEFVLILPETDSGEAFALAERIQQAVSGCIPELTGSVPCDIRVGVSIGIASYPKDGLTLHDLLAQADARMYENKRSRKQKPAA
ncbi:MAG: diguanylate cyclase [Armatimonadetes bacterium]|nr:diguanylate cyclase [Armatimonadota bacterium]